MHVPLQVGMWPTVSLWSTVITLQKREKKSDVSLAIFLYFMAQNTEDMSVFPFMEERTLDYLLLWEII